MPLGLSENLFKRVVSALSLLPIVLGLIYAGGWWFYGFLVLGGTLMALEWNKMTSNSGFVQNVLLVLAAILSPVFVTIGAVSWVTHSDVIICAIAVCILILALLKPTENSAVKNSIIGVLYIGIALFSIALLRAHDENGLLVFWMFVSVWAMDIGGYFAGKSIGGPKLAPKISPKKTWAGLFGGMLLAAIVSFVISIVFAWGHLYTLTLAGFLLAFIAQIGDLYESAVKRRFDIKDSGALIPGHGGILDRVDGLVLAAPAAVLALDYLSIG